MLFGPSSSASAGRRPLAGRLMSDNAVLAPGQAIQAVCGQCDCSLYDCIPTVPLYIIVFLSIVSVFWCCAAACCVGFWGPSLLRAAWRRWGLRDPVKVAPSTGAAVRRLRWVEAGDDE